MFMAVKILTLRVYLEIDKDKVLPIDNTKVEIEWDGDDLVIMFPNGSIKQAEEGEEDINIIGNILVTVPLVMIDLKTLENYQTSLILTTSGCFKKGEVGWKYPVQVSGISITGKIDYDFANLGKIDINDTDFTKRFTNLEEVTYIIN